MSFLTSSWLMIGLDVLMITYTLWVLSLSNKGRFHYGIGAGLLGWLVALHLGLSTHSLFDERISGPMFLGVIVAAVGGVGALLLGTPAIRKVLLGLTQQQLLLLQGIRVFFGATFLTHASVGTMPLVFGIIDGWSHVTAGFLGLAAAFCFSTNANPVRRAWFANLWGLIDILVVASTLSLVILPDLTPHGVMMYAVFLPAPLWLWFHVISIYRLLTSTGEEAKLSQRSNPPKADKLRS